MHFRFIEYGIALRYPNLPLIDIGGQKSNLIPAELCEILPNQPFRGKLLDEHTAEMIKVACRFPNVNAAAIVNRGIQELGFTPTSDTLKAFGVSIGNEMAVVPGRILPSPSIRYAQGGPRVDERAGWNLKDVKFATGGKLESWAVLLIKDNGRDEFTSPNDPELATTLDGFANMCRRSGVNMPQKPKWILQTPLPPKSGADPLRKKAIPEVRKTLLSAPGKVQLLFVILSNGDRHIYSGIKHLFDVYFDVQSICVQVSKFRKERGQLQYFANVALKLNIKSGGVNHTLDPRNMSFLTREPTMMVGIDVTHPGFGTVKGTPSIAAVVASVEKDFGQFPASMRIQESKKEVRDFHISFLPFYSCS
jgi:eukaryotic translation initiation factor 2C